MCNPAVIPMIAQGVQAGGQVFGGMAQARSSQVSNESNAQMARVQAQDVMDRGNVAVNIARGQGRQRIGQQAAAIGASGVDVGSGSSLDVMGDTAAFNEYEAQRLRSEAMREAWGYEEQAKQYDYAAEQAKKQKEFQKTLLTGGLSSDRLWKSTGAPWANKLTIGQNWWMNKVRDTARAY